MSGLTWRPSDMVCQKDDFPGSAAEAATIVQKDDEGAWKRISSSPTEFDFMCYIKSLAYCKNVSTKITMEILKDW